ncbi:MAG TPA: type II toxin-antitoxin system VapB family antitoxin [Allosphingosinicella sp.]
MNIDDELLAAAIEYTGIKERSTVVRMALETFVAIEAERRLAKLKGSLPEIGKVPGRRRRPSPQ